MNSIFWDNAVLSGEGQQKFRSNTSFAEQINPEEGDNIVT
jgi:hypothetical protein